MTFHIFWKYSTKLKFTTSARIIKTTPILFPLIKLIKFLTTQQKPWKTPNIFHLHPSLFNPFNSNLRGTIFWYRFAKSHIHFSHYIIRILKYSVDLCLHILTLFDGSLRYWRNRMRSDEEIKITIPRVCWEKKKIAFLIGTKHKGLQSQASFN